MPRNLTIEGLVTRQIMCGSLASPLLDSIDMVIGDLHGPVLQSPTYDWNQIGEEKVHPIRIEHDFRETEQSQKELDSH